MARLSRCAVFLAVLWGLPAAAGVFPPSPFSDKAAGTTGAAFLKLPTGARSMALGGSYAGLSGDSECLFLNPAGLAALPSQEASFGYNRLLESAYAGALAYARPVGARRDVLGASLVYFSQSALQGYDARGDPTGSFTPRDLAFSAAYALRSGSMQFGGALKLVRSELAGAQGTTLAVDFGLQSRRASQDAGEFDFGLAVQNLGAPLKLGSVSDPLPLRLTGGTAWHISPHVDALIDAHAPVDGELYASLGVELHGVLAPKIRGAARFGYDTSRVKEIDGTTAVTAGFGVDMARVRVDYAWAPLGELGVTHRASVGVRF